MTSERLPIPRNEYPRPQFVREDWLCLNGPWEFEIDAADTGLERGMLGRPLQGEITVPFCPESKLSGVECKDFMNAVWYRKEVQVPAQWRGQNVLLHFQAVDYDTTVWVNSREVGRHRGGWCGFRCDLSDAMDETGKAVIVVRARDLKSEIGKPGGKQTFDQYHNYRCYYERTTGIWQTVWMEPVAKVHFRRPKIVPDLANRMFRVTCPITNSRAGTTVRVVLSDSAGIISDVSVVATDDFSPMLNLHIPEGRLHLWSCESPFLYDIAFELKDSQGVIIDSAASYAGLRSITIDGKAVKLNETVVFQRQVLDQGYYPDSGMTAPTEEDLIRDIELAQKAGFNSARLHQKVFEERFLYHCDRMGYLVWAEFGDWGIDKECPQATYMTQWVEIVSRDLNHPSIVGWCPLNETWKELTD
ncbi:MAG: glycoside hydrolase family 2 protein, partial [Kiritimatiellales bacterium]